MEKKKRFQSKKIPLLNNKRWMCSYFSRLVETTSWQPEESSVLCRTVARKFSI